MSMRTGFSVAPMRALACAVACLVVALCMAALPAMADDAHAAIKPAKAKIAKVATSTSKVKVTWSGVKGATGYQVRISKSSKMTGAKKYTVKSSKARSKTITGAAAYTKYYVQVRAYRVYNGKAYAGAWSSVKAARTLCEHPSAKRKTTVESAACVGDATKIVSCGVCGKTISKTTVAATHSWGPWKVTQEPSLFAGGVSERICSRCGEAQSKQTPHVTRQTVNDYTWDELSQIADKISACPDQESALAVAAEYNLTTNGKLTGKETKSVTLANGKTYNVRILGFCHDDKTGGGKAGISFEFTDVIGEHVMNSDYTNYGGWEASEMRSWLDGTVFPMLPSDLQSAIVSVEKKTNNKGYDPVSSDVTSTSDRLWLLSECEIFGSDCFANQHGGVEEITGSWHGDVLGIEGSQYKLYSDAKVMTRVWIEGDIDRDTGEVMDGYYMYTSNGLGSLARSSSHWWLRTSTPYNEIAFSGEWYRGNLLFDDADYAGGVSPAFCL